MNVECGKRTKWQRTSQSTKNDGTTLYHTGNMTCMLHTYRFISRSTGHKIAKSLPRKTQPTKIQQNDDMAQTAPTVTTFKSKTQRLPRYSHEMREQLTTTGIISKMQICSPTLTQVTMYSNIQSATLGGTMSVDWDRLLSTDGVSNLR